MAGRMSGAIWTQHCFSCVIPTTTEATGARQRALIVTVRGYSSRFWRSIITLLARFETISTSYQLTEKMGRMLAECLSRIRAIVGKVGDAHRWISGKIPTTMSLPGYRSPPTEFYMRLGFDASRTGLSVIVGGMRLSCFFRDRATKA